MRRLKPKPKTKPSSCLNTRENVGGRQNFYEEFTITKKKYHDLNRVEQSRAESGEWENPIPISANGKYARNWLPYPFLLTNLKCENSLDD